MNKIYAALIIFLCVDSLHASSEEGQYTEAIFSFKCLPRGMNQRVYSNAAWQHFNTSGQIIRQHTDTLPKVLPDQQLATTNGMGFNWGFSPVVSALLNLYLSKKEQLNILDIGCGYGIDDLALVQNYTNAYVTGLDLSEKHVAIAEGMKSDLDSEVSDRLVFKQADALKANDFHDLKDFDVVVLSRIFHFYSPEQVQIFLANIYPVLKPNGCVLISVLSNNVSPLTKLATAIAGPCVPMPSSSSKTKVCGVPYFWSYFYSPEQLASIGAKVGYQTLTTNYCGTPHSNSAKKMWWILPNQSQAVGFVALKKPDVK